jgi:hypothetical protein
MINEKKSIGKDTHADIYVRKTDCAHCAFAQSAKVTAVSVIARVSLMAGGPADLINGAVAAVTGADGRGGLSGGVESFIIPIPSRFGKRRDWPEQLHGATFACAPSVLTDAPWSSLLPALREAATAAVNLERAARSPASPDTWEACMGTLRKFLGFTIHMGWRRIGVALLWDGLLLMEYAEFLMSGRDLEGATVARELACLHRLAGLSVGYLPVADRPAAPDYLVRNTPFGSPFTALAWYRIQ